MEKEKFVQEQKEDVRLTKKKEVRFTVLPRISPFDFGEEKIFAGQAAQLACMVTVGDPPIEISWEFEDKALVPSASHRISKAGQRTSVLTIEPADSKHDGTYACIAVNRWGKTVHMAKLQVHG